MSATACPWMHTSSACRHCGWTKEKSRVKVSPEDWVSCEHGRHRICIKCTQGAS